MSLHLLAIEWAQPCIDSLQHPSVFSSTFELFLGKEVMCYNISIIFSQLITGVSKLKNTGGSILEFLSSE